MIYYIASCCNAFPQLAAWAAFKGAVPGLSSPKQPTVETLIKNTPVVLRSCKKTTKTNVCNSLCLPLHKLWEL